MYRALFQASYLYEAHIKYRKKSMVLKHASKSTYLSSFIRSCEKNSTAVAGYEYTTVM